MECFDVFIPSGIRQTSGIIRIQRHFMASIVSYEYVATIESKDLENLGIETTSSEIRITSPDIIESLLNKLGIRAKVYEVILRKSSCHS